MSSTDSHNSPHHGPCRPELCDNPLSRNTTVVAARARWCWCVLRPAVGLLSQPLPAFPAGRLRVLCFARRLRMLVHMDLGTSCSRVCDLWSRAAPAHRRTFPPPQQGARPLMRAAATPPHAVRTTTNMSSRALVLCLFFVQFVLAGDDSVCCGSAAAAGVLAGADGAGAPFAGGASAEELLARALEVIEQESVRMRPGQAERGAGGRRNVQLAGAGEEFGSWSADRPLSWPRRTPRSRCASGGVFWEVVGEVRPCPDGDGDDDDVGAGDGGKPGSGRRSR